MATSVPIGTVYYVKLEKFQWVILLVAQEIVPRKMPPYRKNSETFTTMGELEANS